MNPKDRMRSEKFTSVRVYSRKLLPPPHSEKTFLYKLTLPYKVSGLRSGDDGKCCLKMSFPAASIGIRYHWPYFILSSLKSSDVRFNILLNITPPKNIRSIHLEVQLNPRQVISTISRTFSPNLT